MRTGLRRRALIGLVGGLLTGPTMLVWLSVCRRDADRSVDGHLDGVGRTHPHAGTVCGSGILHRECHGALALRQEHGRFSRGGPGGSGLLDLVVGSCRAAAGDPVDRVLNGDRLVRAPALLFGHPAR
jgi:hypothetical protein